MQEEVENKSVALSIKATKLTASVLKAALRKALAEMEKAKKNPKVDRNHTAQCQDEDFEHL